MSRFYHAQVIELAPAHKKVVIQIQVKHPDYNRLSDSIGFALDLVTDHLAYEETILGEYVDADKMCDKHWIQENANRFIDSCTLVASTSSEPHNLLHGKMEIIFTHKAWMEHLKLHTTWDSTAFEYEIKNYKKCAPEVPNYTLAAKEKESMSKKAAVYDQKNDGWLPIKSSYLKGNMSQRPNIVYVPKYTVDSYTCTDFYTGGKALKETIAAFDLKTVIIKDAHNGPDVFGICVVQGNMSLLQTIDTQGLTYTAFPINRIKEIGVAVFHKATGKPLEYEGFLSNAKPEAI